MKVGLLDGREKTFRFNIIKQTRFSKHKQKVFVYASADTQMWSIIFLRFYYSTVGFIRKMMLSDGEWFNSSPALPSIIDIRRKFIYLLGKSKSTKNSDPRRLQLAGGSEAGGILSEITNPHVYIRFKGILTMWMFIEGNTFVLRNESFSVIKWFGRQMLLTVFAVDRL